MISPCQSSESTLFLFIVQRPVCIVISLIFGRESTVRMNRFHIQHTCRFLTYHLLRPHASGHGIHSPFVYRLTRDLLRRQGRCARTGGTLAGRLAAWYGCDRTVPWSGSPETGSPSTCYTADATVLPPDGPFFHEKDIVVLQHIRRDETTCSNWQQWKQPPGVTVTIDLWHSGIIFFDRRLHRQDFTIYASKALVAH